MHARYQGLNYNRTAGEGSEAVGSKHHMSGIFIGVSF